MLGAAQALLGSWRSVAVDGLDLRVARGEFYAFLGPNGAGKTTALRMIAGLLQPGAGQILIDGVSTSSAIRPRPSGRSPTCPTTRCCTGKLRPLEHLEFVAALWELPAEAAQARAEELLQTLGLWEQAVGLHRRASRAA